MIVANDKYEQESLRDLQAPAADAEGLRKVLGDPQIGAFAVQVVRNEPAHVIHAQIEELFLESKPDDVLLLHFSCHGLKSESGELFFAAANTRPDRLGSTAVSADFVQKCMKATRSRSVVLLLDCCYGGAFAQGVTVRASGDVNVLDSFPQERLGGGRGRAVITASGAMEFALEGTRLADDNRRRPLALFTAALIEGLRTGDADRDQDGWVSLDELYDYVFDKVREQNPHQTPNRHIELAGELYLARNPKPPVRSARISRPAEGGTDETPGRPSAPPGSRTNISARMPALVRECLLQHGWRSADLVQPGMPEGKQLRKARATHHFESSEELIAVMEWGWGLFSLFKDTRDSLVLTSSGIRIVKGSLRLYVPYDEFHKYTFRHCKGTTSGSEGQVEETNWLGIDGPSTWSSPELGDSDSDLISKVLNAIREISAGVQ